MEKEIKEFIKDCKKNPSTKPHCFIVYKTRGVGISTTRYVDRVYENIEDFEKRGVERMLEIPSEFGVSSELYEFD